MEKICVISSKLIYMFEVCTRRTGLPQKKVKALF
jgi:hypothetical protein